MIGYEYQVIFLAQSMIYSESFPGVSYYIKQHKNTVNNSIGTYVNKVKNSIPNIVNILM